MHDKEVRQLKPRASTAFASCPFTQVASVSEKRSVDTHVSERQLQSELAQVNRNLQTHRRAMQEAVGGSYVQVQSCESP